MLIQFRLKTKKKENMKKRGRNNDQLVASKRGVDVKWVRSLPRTTESGDWDDQVSMDQWSDLTQVWMF